MTWGGDRAIREVVDSVVYDVVTCCKHVSYGDVECIINHIEVLDRGQLGNYLPKMLREVYNSLSDEDKNLVMLAIRERLREYAKNLCHSYQYIRRQLLTEEGDGVCDSL